MKQFKSFCQRRLITLSRSWHRQFGAVNRMTGFESNWSDPSMKPRRLSTEKWKGIGKALLRLAIPALFATASFASSPSRAIDRQSGEAAYARKFARDIDRHNPNA